MRIAIIGSRGIPAKYGGFETFVEELAPRLVAFGHTVAVYCRGEGDARPIEYLGVRLVYTPFVKVRELETLSHEASSIVHSLGRSFDLYYFLGTRSSFLYLPLKLTRRAIVLHTDGLEWNRRKWGRIGRTYLRFAEYLAARVAGDKLVVDSRAMQQYFRQQYARESTYIGYGAYSLGTPDVPRLESMGLDPRDYYLVVARLEPENNVDVAVREFVATRSRRSLVVVGAERYGDRLLSRLTTLADNRVRFLGGVYEPGLLDALYAGCYAYIHGHEVGGTNPALLRGMGSGRLVLALHTVFNEENLGQAGAYWEKNKGSLSELIVWADEHPSEVSALGREAQRRVEQNCSWDRAADIHDQLFREVLRRKQFRSRRFRLFRGK